jgi:hypothetical protein
VCGGFDPFLKVKWQSNETYVLSYVQSDPKKNYKMQEENH